MSTQLYGRQDVLQRLPEEFESMARERGELIEAEDAVGRQHHVPGTGT
jgi:hypothetical protein